VPYSIYVSIVIATLVVSFSRYNDDPQQNRGVRSERNIQASCSKRTVECIAAFLTGYRTSRKQTHKWTCSLDFPSGRISAALVALIMLPTVGLEGSDNY